MRLVDGRFGGERGRERVQGPSVRVGEPGVRERARQATHGRVDVLRFVVAERDGGVRPAERSLRTLVEQDDGDAVQPDVADA